MKVQLFVHSEKGGPTSLRVHEAEKGELEIGKFKIYFNEAGISIYELVERDGLFVHWKHVEDHVR